MLRMRYARQGAKAPFKTKEQGRELQNYYKHKKSLKKLLTCDIIKSQKRKEGKHHDAERILRAIRNDRRWIIQKSLSSEKAQTIR